MRQSPLACSLPDNAAPMENILVPSAARRLFNRCNVPASMLGSLQFQRHPIPLELDGVKQIHADLFRRLARKRDPEERVNQFMDYMVVYFSLEHPDALGFDPKARVKREKADYLRMLRGWLFNPDGREGAVLKGWAASRFGLLPRYHGGSLADPEGEHFQRYLAMQSAGVYNTNFLEGQLDLLYAFCQEELARTRPDAFHVRLYRGVNRVDDHEVLQRLDKRRCVVLLNNLNSFTGQRERADEFGDIIMEAEIPLSKIFFYNRLLPGVLKGEDEHLVIGGVYEVLLTG